MRALTGRGTLLDTRVAAMLRIEDRKQRRPGPAQCVGGSHARPARRGPRRRLAGRATPPSSAKKPASSLPPPGSRRPMRLGHAGPHLACRARAIGQWKSPSGPRLEKVEVVPGARRLLFFSIFRPPPTGSASRHTSAAVGRVAGGGWRRRACESRARACVCWDEAVPPAGLRSACFLWLGGWRAVGAQQVQLAKLDI